MTVALSPFEDFAPHEYQARLVALPQKGLSPKLFSTIPKNKKWKMAAPHNDSPYVVWSAPSEIRSGFAPLDQQT